jgi:hypothetical protein
MKPSSAECSRALRPRLRLLDARHVYFLLSFEVARVKHLRDAVSPLAVAGAAVDREYVLARLKENVERAMQHQAVLDRKGKETGKGF